MNTDDTVLTLEQQERVAALNAANGVLRSSKGAFGGSDAPVWSDLVSVAQYILFGIDGLTDLRDMYWQHSGDSVDTNTVASLMASRCLVHRNRIIGFNSKCRFNPPRSVM